MATQGPVYLGNEAGYYTETLKSSDAIGANKVYPPYIYLPRHNYVRERRDLHDGLFGRLPIGTVDANQAGLVLNWFRRVATFYPEFMFSERPMVMVKNNERFTDFLKTALRMVWPVLQHANVDMLRYGTGVLASDPLDPSMMRRYELDCWFEVINEQGMVVADVLMEGRGAYINETATIDKVVYPVMGMGNEAPTWTQYRYEGQQLGAIVNTFELPPRDYSVRQVVSLEGNVDRASIFDDMMPGVTEISRAMTGLAATLKKNQRPHLIGPENLLRTDDNGKVILDPSGMFLPVQPDDPDPHYLQFESAIEAVSEDIRLHQTSLLTYAGLTDMLFSPEAITGLPSGVALRRLLLPFFSRLDYYAQVNNTAIEKIIAILFANRAMEGGEIPQIEPGDIEVDWRYDNVLEDPAVAPDKTDKELSDAKQEGMEEA